MQSNYFLGLSEEGFHKVAYLEWGSKGVLPPILCVHGLTRNAKDFDALAAYLQSNRHLFIPDIVGRGDSDWLKNPLHYTYEQYLADLNTLIARMRCSTLDWIGTSMGGLLGLIMASLDQSPVRKLVLNDVGPQIPIKALARLSKYAGFNPEFNSIQEAVTYFKKIYADFGTLSEAQWETITINSIKQAGDSKWIIKLDPGIKAIPSKSKIAWQQLLLHPYKAFQGTVFDIDLWHLWRKVKCPVLVIRGEHSDILPTSVVEKMQETHPQTTVMTIADVGHAPTLLDDKTHQEIRAFLS